MPASPITFGIARERERESVCVCVGGGGVYSQFYVRILFADRGSSMIVSEVNVASHFCAPQPTPSAGLRLWIGTWGQLHQHGGICHHLCQSLFLVFVLFLFFFLLTARFLLLQIYAILSKKYSNQSLQAFALYKFFQVRCLVHMHPYVA